MADWVGAPAGEPPRCLFADGERPYHDGDACNERAGESLRRAFGRRSVHGLTRHRRRLGPADLGEIAGLGTSHGMVHYAYVGYGGPRAEMIASRCASAAAVGALLHRQAGRVAYVART